ncbi:MAG: DNA mismatch repair endonuclease MutH [Gammaproteobacteria bacterium]
MSFPVRVTPPENEDVLLQRAQALAGRRLADLGRELQQPLPASALKGKGWMGQLLEQCLGASAGSKALPDFPELGVELKTLPLNRYWQPKESTYVCTVPMQSHGPQRWSESWVCRKLQRVLWIPIEADTAIPFGERRIGMACLWSPSATQATVLQQDWEELMELVALGRWEHISAAQGHYLQIRPKAANARSLCHALDEDGQLIQTLPRGFYLRTCLTHTILQTHYSG